CLGCEKSAASAGAPARHRSSLTDPCARRSGLGALDHPPHGHLRHGRRHRRARPRPRRARAPHRRRFAPAHLHRRQPPAHHHRAGGARGGAPVIRLLVTLLAPFVAWKMSGLLVPGIATWGLSRTVPRGTLSVVALGLVPMLTGYITVEVVAAAVPRW